MTVTFSAAGKPFQIIGHRGVRTDADFKNMAPENTIPAFRQAAKQGAAIELDVIATTDGHVVVHHDFETGRMFKLPGDQKKVSDCSVQEIQSAPLNIPGHKETVRGMLGPDSLYKTPKPYQHVKVPELESVLDAVPNTHVYVELKTEDPTPDNPHPNSNGLEEKVAKLIKDKALYDRVTVIGFSAHSLRKIKALDPKIKTGLNVELPPLLHNLPALLPLFMKAYVKHWVGADSLQPSYEDTTPALVKAAHHAGLPLLPWVNHQTRQQEQALFPELIGMGVDGLITNSVDLLHKAVDNARDNTVPPTAKAAGGKSRIVTKETPLCYTEKAWALSQPKLGLVH
jgi:glycerophosphoryl diester phosphodiesterase